MGGTPFSVELHLFYSETDVCFSLFVSSELVAFPGLDNLKNEYPFCLDNNKTGTSQKHEINIQHEKPEP